MHYNRFILALLVVTSSHCASSACDGAFLEGPTVYVNGLFDMSENDVEQALSFFAQAPPAPPAPLGLTFNLTPEQVDDALKFFEQTAPAAVPPPVPVSHLEQEGGEIERMERLAQSLLPPVVASDERREQVIRNVVAKGLPETKAIETVIIELYGSVSSCVVRKYGLWECNLPDCNGKCNGAGDAPRQNKKRFNIMRHVGCVLQIRNFVCNKCGHKFPQLKDLQAHRIGPRSSCR